MIKLKCRFFLGCAFLRAGCHFSVAHAPQTHFRTAWHELYWQFHKRKMKVARVVDRSSSQVLLFVVCQRVWTSTKSQKGVLWHGKITFNQTGTQHSIAGLWVMQANREQHLGGWLVCWGEIKRARCVFGFQMWLKEFSPMWESHQL